MNKYFNKNKIIFAYLFKMIYVCDMINKKVVTVKYRYSKWTGMHVWKSIDPPSRRFEWYDVREFQTKKESKAGVVIGFKEFCDKHPEWKRTKLKFKD